MSGTFALVWCLAAGAIVTFCVIRRIENLERYLNTLRSQLDDLKRELEEGKQPEPLS